jgi:hypothetical protein
MQFARNHGRKTSHEINASSDAAVDLVLKLQDAVSA